jgi:hypothetical protein
LGHGQHFASGGALLNPGVLFPWYDRYEVVWVEPHIHMSAIGHFNTAYPKVTNFACIGLEWFLAGTS